MTDLVAEAIAMCEIMEAVLTEKVNNPLLYTTDKLHIDEIVRVNAQNSQDATNLRFVKAHLAEFEEHKAVEHCKNPLCHGPVCAVCRKVSALGELQTSSPCDFVVTKAKRLLGVSE